MEMALTFNNVPLPPVTHQNSPWIRAADLSRALGYCDESKVSRLYRRNADEFTPEMTQLIEISAEAQNGLLGSAGRCRIFSLRGCHLLAMFARTPVAKQFRRWVLDILDKLAEEERQSLQKMQQLPASGSITPDQQCTLKAMVKTLVEKGGHYAAIWSRFNNHFRIARYCQLPQSRMSEAVDYLMRFEVAPKALPASTPSAPPASEFPAELAELPATRRLFRDIQAAADRLAPCGNWVHLAVRLELGNISTTQAAHAVDLHVNAAWYALGLARSSLLAALAVSKIGR